MTHRKIKRPRPPVLLRIIRVAAVCILLLAMPAFADFIIIPTFTNNFVTDFGRDAATAEASWISAAKVFTTNFSDNITVNIDVDAAVGRSVFGASSVPILSDPYIDLRSRLIADAKTADDFTATGTVGSVTAADPTVGVGTWFVTRAEAKTLSIIASDGLNDGTTVFGAGNAFTFLGSIATGTYDFQGLAEHEISEVLGRLGLGGAGNNYSLTDLFSYNGAGTRVLGNGGASGNQGSFSIDNGDTLLKRYNDQFSDHLDYRDWAPGTNDAFNQFAFAGVADTLSEVDLREIDVIGYDRVPVPEPSPGVLLISGLLGLTWLRWCVTRESGVRR